MIATHVRAGVLLLLLSAGSYADALVPDAPCLRNPITGACDSQPVNGTRPIRRWTTAGGPHFVLGVDASTARSIGGGLNIGNRGEGKTESEQRPTGCPKGELPGDADKAGNPIIFATGNKVEFEDDFTSEGELPLGVSRTYNRYWNEIGIFGPNWISNLDFSLTRVSGPNFIWLQRPDGRRIRFNHVAGTSEWLEAKPGPVAKIVFANSVYTHYTENQAVETYNLDGHITRLEAPTGVAWDFTYINKYLDRVTHSSGRFIQLTWVNGRISTIADPSGKIYSYTHHATSSLPNRGRLATATLPGTPATRIDYHYEDTRFVGALTGKSFNGVRYSYFTYDAAGRANSTRHAGDVNKHSFVYESAAGPPPPYIPPTPRPGGWCNEQGICFSPQSVPVGDEQDKAFIAPTAIGNAQNIVSVIHTNPLGKVTTYHFANGRRTDTFGAASANCPAANRSMTYDANGYPVVDTNFRGIQTHYIYNAKGQLLERKEAAGLPEERVTTYVWDAATNLLLSEKISTQSGDVQKMSRQYNPDRSISSISYQNLTAIGIVSQTITTAYSYTRHPNGIIASITRDGPQAGSVDAFVVRYNQFGDIISVENAMRVVESFANHDGSGRPGLITGQNGEQTTYLRDDRGRVIETHASMDGGLAVTKSQFNGAGSLSKVERADGSSETYHYDDARRLTSLISPRADGGYDTTLYEYNLNSQAVATRYGVQSSVPGSFVQQRSAFYDYDEIGRQIGSRGNNGQNERKLFDANGNVEKDIDSLNRETVYVHDALDRVIKRTDATGAFTEYAYDALDQMVWSKDARGLVSSFGYDGLGQLWSESNPDSGAKSFTYSASGQLLSQTRNDGSSLTYTYSGALARLSAVTASSGEVRSFQYDNCTNGFGRVCSMDARDTSFNSPHSQVQFKYTQEGQISQRLERITNIHQQVVGYRYDPLGRVRSVSYPDGLLVEYDRVLGRFDSVRAISGGTQTVLADGFSYRAGGLVEGWQFGNGIYRTYTYDDDGRVLGIGASASNVAQSLTMMHNANNLITAMTNGLPSGISGQYEYDFVGRLLSHPSSNGEHHSLAFDGSGNRTSRSVYPSSSSQIDTFLTSPTSNRLESVSGASAFTFTYNTRGHRATESSPGRSVSYTYDGFDRLKSVNVTGAATRYYYDANGQRVRKNTGLFDDTYFAYASGGRLLAERRNAWKNYIWLGDQLLAVMNAAGLAYVHTDQVGRPEVATDASQAIVWRANNHAHGREVVVNSIEGIGVGFPGQYWDAESGLWHNVNRDYDARVGRYIQSDPLGIRAGFNTYAYAGGNPVSLIDPLGLTQEDIDCLYALATERETDLKFPKKYPITKDLGGVDKDGFKTHGRYNPVTRQIVLHSDYLEPLSPSDIRQLYDTIVHEVMHPNWGWRAASEAGHARLAKEAGERTEKADPVGACGCDKN